MIQKLKDVLSYIVAPVAVLVAVILGLLARITSLETEVREKELEKELENDTKEKDLVDAKAADAVADYEHYRDEFFSQDDVQGRDS